MTHYEQLVRARSQAWMMARHYNEIGNAGLGHFYRQQAEALSQQVVNLDREADERTLSENLVAYLDEWT